MSDVKNRISKLALLIFLFYVVPIIIIVSMTISDPKIINIFSIKYVGYFVIMSLLIIVIFFEHEHLPSHDYGREVYNETTKEFETMGK